MRNLVFDEKLKELREEKYPIKKKKNKKRRKGTYSGGRCNTGKG